MVCILLEIRNLQVLHVESILLCLKALDRIKCCEVFRPWEPNEDSFAYVK